MQDSESKLARLRGQTKLTNAVSSRSSLALEDGVRAVKTERRSNSPVGFDRNEGSSKNNTQSNKPELVIPALTPKVVSPPVLLPRSSANNKASMSSNSEATPPVTGGGKSDKSHIHNRLSSEQQNVESNKDKGTKRKFGNTFTGFDYLIVFIHLSGGFHFFFVFWYIWLVYGPCLRLCASVWNFLFLLLVGLLLPSLSQVCFWL